MILPEGAPDGEQFNFTVLPVAEAVDFEQSAALAEEIAGNVLPWAVYGALTERERSALQALNPDSPLF